MPKLKNQKLLDKNFIEEFDYEKTKLAVLDYFKNYRNYKIKVSLYDSTISSPLSNDNLGIYSSFVNDPTSRKAERFLYERTYIENMEKTFYKLKLRLTDDEKIIFNMAILSKHTDQDIAEALSLEVSSIYCRKKSCFIKVAIFYNKEVLK